MCDVNKQSIELVDKTQNALDHVKSSYIRLANAPEHENKNDLLDKANRDIGALHSRIQDLTFNMHLDLKTRDIDAPPDDNAILRSISRQYGSDSSREAEIVRNEIRALSDNKCSPIRVIKSFRNNAVHADWTGKYRDVKVQETDEMIEQLRIVILKLNTIGEAIDILRSR